MTICHIPVIAPPATIGRATASTNGPPASTADGCAAGATVAGLLHRHARPPPVCHENAPATPLRADDSRHNRTSNHQNSSPPPRYRHAGHEPNRPQQPENGPAATTPYWFRKPAGHRGATPTDAPTSGYAAHRVEQPPPATPDRYSFGFRPHGPPIENSLKIFFRFS